MKYIYENAWFRVGLKGSNYIVDEPLCHNSAAILMKLESGKFVFVKQDRPAIGKRTIEIPRGYAKKNECAEDCAIREAYEETGIKIKPSQLDFLTKIHPNSGILTSSVSLFFALVNDDQFKSSATNEIDSVVLLSPEQVIEHCRNGSIKDSFSLSAFAMLFFLKNSFTL